MGQSTMVEAEYLQDAIHISSGNRLSWVMREADEGL
jgi:hypothetical protein